MELKLFYHFCNSLAPHHAIIQCKYVVDCICTSMQSILSFLSKVKTNLCEKQAKQACLKSSLPPTSPLPLHLSPSSSPFSPTHPVVCSASICVPGWQCARPRQRRGELHSLCAETRRLSLSRCTKRATSAVQGTHCLLSTIGSDRLASAAFSPSVAAAHSSLFARQRCC